MSTKILQPCPFCGATNLTPTVSFGRAVLEEPGGQLHVCPDRAAENNRYNEEQVRAYQALQSSRRYSDTTGNRKPRWVYRGGCVEPY